VELLMAIASSTSEGDDRRHRAEGFLFHHLHLAAHAVDHVGL
jgi:hypothetical protein